MKLKITHTGSVRGQKLYTVSDGQDRFFTGTLEEVKRFIILHNRKVGARKQAAEAMIAQLRSA